MAAFTSLDGIWQLTWYNGQRGDPVERLWQKNAPLHGAIEAHVPGSVHLDLMHAGLLADPNTENNVLAARWVEEYIWNYRKEFHTPRHLHGERVMLTFECLDLAATISVNRQVVGSHANAFYPCSFDITDVLTEDENILVVSVEAGLYQAADKQGEGYNARHIDSTFHKRHWLRKTQSSFEWDWAPRLLNVGIRGKVRLEVVKDVFHIQSSVVTSISDDLTEGWITGKILVENILPEELEGWVTLANLSSAEKITKAVRLNPGENQLECRMPVEHPALWYPVGYGEQALTDVCLSLAVNGCKRISTQKKVGFRKVRINQSAHPDSGNYFVFEINNTPIFLKGANFVPADILLARLDAHRYQILVDRALEANFNMLRIWGGGLYESDDLYNYCDEKGIVLWQEFIFACSKYPAQDAAFLADVKKEAAYQVRRLAHHPSLIAWCGNNEIEEGHWHWGYEQGQAHTDYALYHLVLPRIVKEEDGTRYYQPSSPYSRGIESPRRDDMGDQHPWTVGFANTDFRDYRKMICRFPNEGGILGPTALPTVRACLPTGQEFPYSFAWAQHDNGIAFWGKYNYPNAMLEQWLGKSIDQMTLEEYVYYGGVLQGEGLTEYIRNFRRRMFNSSGAIFWMYNDVWPATRSWTIVDYYLRRTPAFFPVRRAFAPIITALVVEEDMVRVFGVNEKNEQQAELQYGLFSLDGKYPITDTKTVVLAPNASTLLAEFPLKDWQSQGINTHAAYAILRQDGREIARDRLILSYFKELAWQPAEVKIEVKNGKALFNSDTFAWRVCLDLNGETAYSDNFFDIFPGIPTELEWSALQAKPHVLWIGNLVK